MRIRLPNGTAQAQGVLHSGGEPAPFQVCRPGKNDSTADAIESRASLIIYATTVNGEPATPLNLGYDECVHVLAARIVAEAHKAPQDLGHDLSMGLCRLRE